MKKKLLTTAVAAALAAGAGVQTASADVILGPYYTTQLGSETFVTIVTKAGFEDPNTSAVVPPDQKTSWIYLTKDITNLEEDCRHSDDTGFQTYNDVGSFALENKTTLFDDQTSIGAYVASGFSGMVTVSNNDFDDGIGSVEGSIYGEQIIVDLGAGAIVSQRMLNHPNQLFEGSTQYNEYGYNIDVEELPGAIVPNPSESYAGIPAFFAMPDPGYVPTVVWAPLNILNVTWQVSALAGDLSNTAVPDMTMTVQWADSTGAPGFFYDRDENRKSTSKAATFNCIAQLKASDFINPEQVDAAAGGGWAHLQIVDLPSSGTPATFSSLGLLVYKIEQAGGISIWTSENRFDL